MGADPPSDKQPPPNLSARDALNLWVENILVMYGGKEPRDKCPVAQGEVSDVFGSQPFFVSLHRYFQASGPVYKLAFGPKVFIVVQDPVMSKRILRDDSISYDKGILAEILEDIMGKGLIPADYATWKVRRRAIAPGFHKAWLNSMTRMFGQCAMTLCDKLEQLNVASALGLDSIDMETEYCSLTLDIIGKAVFNYDFNSVCDESPVIKAVYRVLREAEHRSTNFLPYWKLPGAPFLFPRQGEFQRDIRLINDTLNDLIRSAKLSTTSADLSELENRDYANASDPSLLRFIVDLRGEETTNVQLRDDLMTMLIAGHETTAALLTWATFELAQHPDVLQRAQAEVDAVIGNRAPTYDDVKRLDYVRRVLAETLRLYPEPPVLIRRALADVSLPQPGAVDEELQLMRGTDIFINVYSMHRAPALWERPEDFDPDRWLRPFANPGVEGWKGYMPAADLQTGNPLYPTEGNADFAFLPFGGGTRKCVGDQFAMLEAVVSLSMLLRRFDMELACEPSQVGMDTGATIHTRNGLHMLVRLRKHITADMVPVSTSAPLPERATSG